MSVKMGSDTPTPSREGVRTIKWAVFELFFLIVTPVFVDALRDTRL